jgi:hypothetical protein
MKRLICSAAVASALVAATTVPSGAVTLVTPISQFFTEGSTVNLSFQIDLTGSGGFIEVGLPVTPQNTMGLASEFFIPGFTATLKGPGVNMTQSAIGDSLAFMLKGTSLAIGDYFVTVTGTGPVTNVAGGSLAANIFSSSGSTVSPVPIPGSLVLFLSGLGLLGFWGWTKRRKGGLGSASLEATAC